LAALAALLRPIASSSAVGRLGAGQTVETVDAVLVDAVRSAGSCCLSRKDDGPALGV
jgi:hypothetical protein